MLCLISCENAVDKELATVDLCLAGGFDYFHLRKPAFTQQELQSLVNSLPEFIRERTVQHIHPGQRICAGIFRIHLSTVARKEGIYRGEDKSPVQIVSTAVHDVSEMRELRRWDYQYAFFAPVFPSISKPGHGPHADAVMTLSEVSEVPLLALGGVTARRLPEVRRRGYAGAAICGAIWQEKYSDRQALVREFMTV